MLAFRSFRRLCSTNSSNSRATGAWLASGGDGRVTLHSEEDDEDDPSIDVIGGFADHGSARNRTGQPVVVGIGINAYGTSTTPRPTVIERSSCTSSSPRPSAFLAADNLRQNQLNLHLHHLDGSTPLPPSTSTAVTDLVSSNRTRILTLLSLPPSIALLTCASGTDAEMLAALTGVAAASPDAVKRWTEGGGGAVADGAVVLSVLMPGTGSGVGDAAGLRHHSAAAPGEDRVQPGEVIIGVAEGSVVAVEPAKEGVDLGDGPELLDWVQEKRTHLAKLEGGGGEGVGVKPHVVLHAIAGSKTGLHHPPIDVVDRLVEGINECTVVVDACQMRVTPKYVRDQLDKGYVVLLTGSKFYGGPPFAGACLLPAVRAQEVEALAEAGGVPDGLKAYFTRDDVPPSMPNLRAVLPETPNAGLALRWAAALHSMERYHALPNNMTNRVAKRWVARVQALAEGFYPAVEVLDVGLLGEHERGYRVGRVNTIVSLMVRTTGDRGGLLGVRGLKQLQLLLGTDLSELCDGVTFPKSARDVARIRTQLGQPVMLGGGAKHGVVRVALGAVDICEVVEAAIKTIANNDQDHDDDDPYAELDALANAIDRLIVDDIQLFRKIELLANHWEQIALRCDSLPAAARRWHARLAAEGVSPSTPSGTRTQTITNVPVAWLKPHEQIVHRERVDALVDAVVRWDAFRKPLLVDRESGSILDGHHRYYAALEMGLERVPAALVDYLEDESIRVDVWPGGDHGVETISKEDVIQMCLSADVFPPKTSRHTFGEPLAPIFVPLDELRRSED